MSSFNPNSPAPDGPKLTGLGKFFVFLFVVGCLYGAYYLYSHKSGAQSSGAQSGGHSDSGGLFGGGSQVEIGIAFGTEKQRWLEWAVTEFGKTSDGKRIKVNLI